jgi:hypothetical protein
MNGFKVDITSHFLTALLLRRLTSPSTWIYYQQKGEGSSDEKKNTWLNA